MERFKGFFALQMIKSNNYNDSIDGSMRSPKSIVQIAQQKSSRTTQSNLGDDK